MISDSLENGMSPDAEPQPTTMSNGLTANDCAHPPSRRNANPMARLGLYSSLFVALQAKHAPTAAHCLRVGQSLSAWGLYYQLPEKILQQIELAGLLHDLGKIGIPERILQKPSQLLPEERGLIDLHPQVGIEILSSAGLSSEVLDAIQLTGAWFNLSNRGDLSVELPLIQRILSIADAFDAMTSEQPYRRAMTANQAIEELRRMAGTQFDPKLVHSFCSLIDRADENLENAVQMRWKNIQGGHSISHLFKNNLATEMNTGIVVQSLKNVFHRKMMNHMNDAVIFVDTEMRILEWNQAAERMTGIQAEAVLHLEWIPDLVGLCDQRGNLLNYQSCPIREAMAKGETFTKRLRLKSSGQDQLKIEAQLMPILDDRGVLRGGAMLMGDASDQADLEEKVIELHTQATQDPLTKVSNRAELNRRLPEFVAECQNTGKFGTVVICDIDFFKRINDTFGHAAGDEALKVFAQVLKAECRESDLVARYGGEEFVLLCSDCDLVSAVRVAESIRHRLQRTPIAALKGKCLTASFGVAEICAGDSSDAPLERADHALLEAKQTGRDRVVSVAGNGSKKPAKPSATEVHKTGGSWLSWLGAGQAEPIAIADLLSTVPRAIVVEKLKGFISESKAELLSINDNEIQMRIDCRTAPMQRRANDRPSIFEVKLSFQDVEIAGSRVGTGFQTSTLLKVELYSVRNRDRRTDALVDQANRLRHSIQSYLIANPIESSQLNKVIPVYQPGNDGR